PAAEQGAGPAGAAGPPAGRGAGRRGGRGPGRTQEPGPHRGPLRAGAHLQLPGEPHLRPPGRLQGLQPRPGPRRGAGRGHPGPRGRRHQGAVGGRPAVNLLLDEVARATLRLAEAGVASPRTDAEELAAFVHGVRRGELHTVADSAFDARYWECVARRAAREPLQHITGRAYFRYLELAVGPGVFVPRPETEMMVSWAID